MALNITELLKPGKLKISHYITLLFLFSFICVNVVLTVTFYKAASRQAMNDIMQRLSDTVAIAAQSLDGDLHAGIAASKDQDSPAYRDFKTTLQNIQQVSSDIHFIYTMKKDTHGRILFVVDAETDPTQMATLEHATPTPVSF